MHLPCDINDRIQSVSELSVWYLQTLSSRISSKKLHMQFVLQSCSSLRHALATEKLLSAVSLDTICLLCETVYASLSQLLDFASPLMIVRRSQCKLRGGGLIHILTAVATLNGLVSLYNVSVLVWHCRLLTINSLWLSHHQSVNTSRSELQPLPGCLKERIKPLLDALGGKAKDMPRGESKTGELLMQK